MTCVILGGSAPAGPLHEKYGLSKTREAEDMCNYSEYLKQKAKEEKVLKAQTSSAFDTVSPKQ